MVSLETRCKYLSDLEKNTKLWAFYQMLCGNTVTAPVDTIETEEIYYCIIRSIISSDKAIFDSAYAKISRRNPSKDSSAPFVHDDLLIFCLVLGVVMFSGDKTWLRGVISLRNPSTITSTFESLLNSNYENRSNLPEIVVPFLSLLNSHILNEDYLNAAYLSVANNSQLFRTKHDFYTLLAIRTYDLIVTSKRTEGGELVRLVNFEKVFKNRVKVISLLVYNSLLIVSVYVLLISLRTYPSIKQVIDDLGVVVGVLGVTVANFVPFLRKRLTELIMKLLGWRRSSISNLTGIK